MIQNAGFFYTIRQVQWRSVLAVVLSLFVLACSPQMEKSHLEKLQQRQVINIGILFNPTSYYIDASGAAGFEYELSQRLGEYLNLDVNLVPSFHIAELLPKLKSGHVDIVIGGIAKTESRAEAFRFAPPYFYIDQKLVFKQGRQRPKSFEEVDAPITVGSHTNHAELMAAQQTLFPNLEVENIDLADQNDLLEQLMAEEIDYTLADSHSLALIRRYYPDISVAFTVREELPLSWLMNKNDDDSLYAVLIEFFGELHQSGELTALEDKYFGHVEQFNYVDTRLFMKAVDEVLPKYKTWFQDYSGDLDWRLIAAQSYQESHWNPRAKSPTGVRGIMMLTQPTAKQMWVKSRLDAESNIRGGAKYLNLLIQRVPDRINESDRPWFALAAYNVGWGHVQDARKLTRQLGGDPDKWVDVKQHLPKLRQKKYYKTTRYGFARGDEAVTYVSNIRRYYDTLTWIDEQAAQQLKIEQKLEQKLEQRKQQVSQQEAESDDSE